VVGQERFNDSPDGMSCRYGTRLDRNGSAASHVPTTAMLMVSFTTPNMTEVYKLLCKWSLHYLHCVMLSVFSGCWFGDRKGVRSWRLL